MLSWCTWWRGTPIKPKESVFQACEALAIFRDLRDAEGEEWRCGGTAGARSLCCLSADFHVTQLYIQSMYIYIYIYDYTIIRTCHILEYIQLTHNYCIHCMMQYVFHTIEVYMVYYHVGICHIIYVVFLPQISKPQCFHSFIDGIRGWFVKQFWCLKMTAFSVVFHSKSMSPKIFGPANPFVSFGISNHFTRKPPFLFCCGFYWSHSLFMRSTSCCSLTKYLNDSSPIVNYSPLTSQHQ